MIFNSLQFILLFLPLCYAGFLLVHRGMGWSGAYAYLVIASLVFYAQFNLVLAMVLLGSICGNFLLGYALMILQNKGQQRGVLAFSILLNLIVLGYFKYMNFFIDIAGSVVGREFSNIDILIPVGVSFFTFTQIGYLIEVAAGRVQKVDFVRYALFAGFFPCVTAGPLLLQSEMLSQMKDRRDSAFNPTRVAIGLTMFGIGLAKKVMIADSIAPHSDVVFDGVSAGHSVAMLEAWLGSLAYALQLYFDFSGYSDMAIGIAFLFGFRLPLNFNSPFKATSISEFWNRWHMTMTRFFTTFVYTHLAMSNGRRAIERQYGRFNKWLVAGAVPVFCTFLIAGIWHGAGWTFVVYGLIHGTALAVNHGWREWRLPAPPSSLSWLLTMAVVVCGLVVFRSPNLETASAILLSMWGMGPSSTGVIPLLFVEVNLAQALGGILMFGVIVLLMPNSHEIMRQQWVSCDKVPTNILGSRSIVLWSPTAGWATVIAVLIVVAVTSLNDTSGFLYYDF